MLEPADSRTANDSDAEVDVLERFDPTHLEILSKSAISIETATAYGVRTWTAAEELPEDLPDEDRAMFARLLAKGPLLAFPLRDLVELDQSNQCVTRTVWQVRDPNPEPGAPKYLQQKASGTSFNIHPAMVERINRGDFDHVVMIEGTKQSIAGTQAILQASEEWNRVIADGGSIPSTYRGTDSRSSRTCAIDPRRLVAIGMTGCGGWTAGRAYGPWTLKHVIARLTPGMIVFGLLDADMHSNERVWTAASELDHNLRVVGGAAEVYWPRVTGGGKKRAGDKRGLDDILSNIAPDLRRSAMVNILTARGGLGQKPAAKKDKPSIDVQAVSDRANGRTIELTTLTVGDDTDTKIREIADACWSAVRLTMMVDPHKIRATRPASEIIVTLQTRVRTDDGDGEREFEDCEPFDVPLHELGDVTNPGTGWIHRCTPNNDAASWIRTVPQADKSIEISIRTAIREARALIPHAWISMSPGWQTHPVTGKNIMTGHNGSIGADGFTLDYTSSHEDLTLTDPWRTIPDEWNIPVEALVETLAGLSKSGRAAYLGPLAHAFSSQCGLCRPKAMSLIPGPGGSGKSEIVDGLRRMFGVPKAAQFDDSNGVISEHGQFFFNGLVMVDDGRDEADDSGSEAGPVRGRDAEGGRRNRKVQDSMARIGYEEGKRHRRLVRDELAPTGYRKSAYDPSSQAVIMATEKRAERHLGSTIERIVEFPVSVKGTWENVPGIVGKFRAAHAPGGPLASLVGMILAGTALHKDQGVHAATVARYVMSQGVGRALGGKGHRGTLVAGIQLDPAKYTGDGASTWEALASDVSEAIYYGRPHWTPRQAEVAATYTLGLAAMKAGLAGALDIARDSLHAKSHVLDAIRRLIVTLDSYGDELDTAIASSMEAHLAELDSRLTPAQRAVNLMRGKVTAGSVYLAEAAVHVNPGVPLVGCTTRPGYVRIVSSWMAEVTGMDTRSFVNAMKADGFEVQTYRGTQTVARGKADRVVDIPLGAWVTVGSEPDEVAKRISEMSSGLVSK